MCSMASRACAGDVPAGLSERHRLAEHTIPDGRPEPARGDDVDVTAQERLQVHEQAAHVEQGAARLHLDKEVYVAGLVGLTAGHGSEDPDIPGPVTCRQPEYLLAPRPEKLVDAQRVAHSVILACSVSRTRRQQRSSSPPA